MLYSYRERGAFTCREAGKLAVLYWVLCYEAKFARGRVVSRRAVPRSRSLVLSLSLSLSRARARGHAAVLLLSRADAPGAGARGCVIELSCSAQNLHTTLTLYAPRTSRVGTGGRARAHRAGCAVSVWPMHRIFVATGGPTFTPSPQCSANNLFQLERQAPSKLADVVGIGGESSACRGWGLD